MTLSDSALPAASKTTPLRFHIASLSMGRQRDSVSCDLSMEGPLRLAGVGNARVGGRRDPIRCRT